MEIKNDTMNHKADPLSLPKRGVSCGLALIFTIGFFAVLGLSTRWLYADAQALNTLRALSPEGLGAVDILVRPETQIVPRAGTTPTRSVTFRLLAPSAQTVSVAGSFDEFDASRHPLERAEDGMWEAILELPPGTHEYKFNVDGRWELDPANPDRTPAPNECSLLEVSP